MNPQAAINLVQELTVIHEHYEDRPHLFIAIMAAGSMLIAVAALSVVALGSFTVLLTCLGWKGEEPKPLPPEPYKTRIIGGRKVHSRQRLNFLKA